MMNALLEMLPGIAALAVVVFVLSIIGIPICARWVRR